MTCWRALAIGLVATALAASAGCGSKPTGTPSVTFTTTAGTPTATPTRSTVCDEGTPIYLVQPYAPAAELTAAYKPVMTSLSKSLGCTVQFRIAASIQDEMWNIAHGRVTFAEFAGLGSGFALAGPHPATDVVATYESDFNGTPAAFLSALYDDPRFGDVDLTGLAGKRVALTTPGSLSGDYFPRAALTEAGVIGKVSTVYTGSHLQALRDLTCHARVSSRTAPCAKVNYASLNSRVMGPAAESHEWDPGKYTQIWHSDPIPYTAIGVAPKVTAEVRKQLQAALLAVPVASVRGIARMIQFDTPRIGTGLVAITSSSYCQSSNLDLCDVIKTLKLTPEQVRPLDGEGL
ncbi:MAG TPA: PhnD/SsuA/transferrin family substrate-binding protein [Nocardioides sp.]|nr:PhnD/SsuA/transferrin family substrate-binding protein [Nocardioides sp.]